MTSSLVFERTAAIVKPPIKSMIVGENICEKTYLAVRGGNGKAYFVASEADIR